MNWDVEIDIYTLSMCCVVLSQLAVSDLCNPTDCNPPGSSVQGDSPGKITRVGCHAVLQGIVSTQGLNLGYQVSHMADRFFTS